MAGNDSLEDCRIDQNCGIFIYRDKYYLADSEERISVNALFIMTNQETLSQFYAAFQAADAEKMVACYHDEVTFEDPAFGKLEGEQAKAMWKMLIARGGEQMSVEVPKIIADEHGGSSHWIATYPYGPQKRQVVNKVYGTFTFQDGKILTHKDDFDLWAWSRQALGLPGILLGWSSFMRKKIQANTGELLTKYMNSSS